MKCNICPFFTENCHDLIRHFVKKHKHEESFDIRCAICDKSFQNVGSLRSHIWVTHRELMQKEADQGSQSSSSTDASLYFSLPSDTSMGERVEFNESANNDSLLLAQSGLSVEGSDGVSDPENCQISNENNYEGVQGSDQTMHGGEGNSKQQKQQTGTCHVSDRKYDELQWYSSEFLLKLREEGMISYSALSRAAAGINDLFHSYTETIKVRILQDVEKDGTVSEENIKSALKDFRDGIFVDGASKSSLEAFCEEYGEFLMPEPLVLKEETVFAKDDESQVKTVQHCAYICHFLPALKRLMKRPDVLECVDNPMDVSDDEVIRSYRDGKYCKQHKILSKPKSLAVVFTFDELEVSSPLGPKKHKLGLYYWTLANFSGTIRSSLKSIQLYAIVNSKDLKEETPVSKRKSLDAKFENHTKIMAPFIRDIKTLENGIEVKTKPSTVRKFEGSLYCVTGDAPAVNVFCEYKESVGPAKKPCHLCLVNNDDENNEMKVIFNEDMYQKRTLALRDQHLQSIHVSKLVKDRQENSTLSGVNGPSVIEGLESFHYVEAFVFDLMHILHEGVIAAHLQMLLQHIVSYYYFTIDEINRGVSRIANQILVTDRPANIKIEHLQTGLRQNAGQFFSLAMCLPFVLMEKAEELVERLENFIRMIKISMCLLSYEGLSADLMKLKSLIREHNETFTVHYPSFDMTPKFHFIFHLPSQIMQFGPSRVTWTMRFEAMHSYFKDLMRIMKNFINPPYSCSYRYECLRTAQMLMKPGGEPVPFFDFKTVTTYSKSIKIKDHPYSELLVKILGKKNLTVVTCSSITTNGVTFSRKSVVLIDVVKPVFAQVEDIVIYGEIQILLLTNLKTEFEPLCNAFVVESRNQVDVNAIFIDNLIFFNTLPSPTVDGVQYVIPKYHRLGFMTQQLQ